MEVSLTVRTCVLSSARHAYLIGDYQPMGCITHGLNVVFLPMQVGCIRFYYYCDLPCLPPCRSWQLVFFDPHNHFGYADLYPLLSQRLLRTHGALLVI